MSVFAEKVPLAQILDEIARKTGVEIRGSEGLEERVSVRLSVVPLHDGLVRLLAGVHSVIVEEPPARGIPRPVLVLIFGKRAAALPEEDIRATTEHLALRAEGREDWPIVLLGDPDPGIRRWAVERLGGRRDEHAFFHLLARLDDQDSEVRRGAIAGLGEYGEAAVVPLKVLLLGERSPEVRVAILRLLGQIDPHGVFDLLRVALNDDSAPSRIAAVEALGHAGSPAAAQALVRAARDAEPAVRIVALRTLAFYLRDDTAKRTIERGLFDEDATVRAAAADLLEAVSE